MWNRIWQFLVRLLLVEVLIFLVFVAVGVFPAQEATALIRQQEEAPGEMLFQARHTLRDETGESWQVVFFKRVKFGEVSDINLRLAGFPGRVEFSHPQPLILIRNDGKVLEARDRFSEKSPAPNIGEYSIKEIVSELPTNSSLSLSLPLVGDRPRVKINIPLPVVLEWQEVVSR